MMPPLTGTTAHETVIDMPWPALPLYLDLSAGPTVGLMPDHTAAFTAAHRPGLAHRAALLAQLAPTQSATMPDLAEASLAEAQLLAERLDSPTSRVYVLMVRYATDLSPESLPNRQALAGEILALLADAKCAALRPALLPTAYFMLLGALLEAGDIRGLDEALSAKRHLDDLLTPMLSSRYALWFRCARATMDGRFAAAEALAEEAHALALDGGDIDADAVRIGQIAIVRWMQGRISEMEPVFLHLRHADPGEPVWAAAVAWIWQHQGRVQAARGLIESLPTVAGWPRGRNWLAAVAIAAEVAAEVGSDALVEQLRLVLEPFAGRLVPIGLGVTCWGTVARPLALIAARQNRYSDALGLYRSAIDLAARMGAQAWLAEAQTELAGLLIEHDSSPAATTEARMLATESMVACRQLGLHAGQQRASVLLEQLAGAADADAASNSTGAPDPRIAPGAPRVTVLGEFTITLPDGSVPDWKSRKAETLLKILLARRGAALTREAAIDMLWPGSDPYLLRNRLAVAVAAVRRALDPHRALLADTYLTTSREVLRLRIDRLDIDVEELLSLADRARATTARNTTPRSRAAPSGGLRIGTAVDDDDRSALLRRIVTAYTGDAFAEDPYEAWAERLRRQAHLAYFAAAHELADVAAGRGDDLSRAELYRAILHIDPYDRRAHDGLIAVLTAMGAADHLATAQADLLDRLGGIEPDLDVN